MPRTERLITERLIHASSNGDTWYLVRGTDGQDVSVRHNPNIPSGGASSCIPLGEFLTSRGNGPEHQELLRLIGTLVDGRPEEDADRVAQLPR